MKSKVLKIIIPLAGPTDFFESSTYKYPKPLIEVLGKPMIQWVVEKIYEDMKSNFDLIFIINQIDSSKFYLDNTLRRLAPNSKIIKLKSDTKGALCSVLMAIDEINETDEILVMNGDQIIDFDLEIIYRNWQSMNSDGGLVTFNSVHPKWSYALIDDNLVLQTAEKNPISQNAIAGYYYFKNASTMIEAAFSVLKNESHVNGAYFLSSVFNELILLNKKINSFSIDDSQYHSFYSPDKIKQFELRYKENGKV